MAVKKASKKSTKKAAKKPVSKKKKATAQPKTKKRKAPAKQKEKAGRRQKGAVSTATASTRRKERLREILLKKRNEIVRGLEAQMGRKLTMDQSQRIDSAMDSADLSSLDMEQGVDYSLLEMKYEQYKDIAEAFRKLQNDTYGLCEECGQEIDIKRLEVNPLARYCIECKTRKEEIEKIQKEETRFKE